MELIYWAGVLALCPVVYRLGVRWSKWNYQRYHIQQMEQQFKGEN